jgi:hypothetical protein
MNWKEQFDSEFVQSKDFGDGLDDYLLVGNVPSVPSPIMIKNFISKEIIEKILEDIHTNNCLGEHNPNHFPGLSCECKCHQLRDKWLQLTSQQ